MNNRNKDVTTLGKSVSDEKYLQITLRAWPITRNNLVCCLFLCLSLLYFYNLLQMIFTTFLSAVSVNLKLGYCYFQIKCLTTNNKLWCWNLQNIISFNIIEDWVELMDMKKANFPLGDVHGWDYTRCFLCSQRCLVFHSSQKKWTKMFYCLPKSIGYSKTSLGINFISFLSSDAHGQTPLHYAALQGSKRSAELILASKPESLNVTDKNQVCGILLPRVT